MRVSVRVYRTKAQAAWSFPKPKAKNRGGRPRIVDRRASERHETRAPLPAGTPVHVTMRIVPAVGAMRKRHLYRAVRKATLQAYAANRIRIVHLSIQHDHVHAIVEASSRDGLARGMQGFQISAARHINRACRRTGQVFADRYHAEQLTTPTQARNAISYVINNWRKHREDHHGPFALHRVDPFSSGPTYWKISGPFEPLQTSPPSTWMLKIGIRRLPAIMPTEIPSGSSLLRKPKGFFGIPPVAVPD